MIIYKELSFSGTKKQLELFKINIYKYVNGDWTQSTNPRLRNNYLAFDYVGKKYPQAEVSIYCGKDAIEEGKICVGNIVPLEKEQLTITEYNSLLDEFYVDIILPYKKTYSDIIIAGPTSDSFNPLDVISDKALNKLKIFCDSANKTTGSSHPDDEIRWFDFICQTVEDEKVFDYDTMYRFLMDENYWGKKENSYIGVIGHFAWDEEYAAKLASEYDDYVRILKYYKKTRDYRR